MTATGTLYVVATPIGNLEDMTLRAIRILGEVDVIAAEDTRHSQKLLQRFGISTSVIPFHQHNQAKQSGRLIRILLSGKDIAMICDAGTPLISDPGRALVDAAHEHEISLVPIPGASALTCALSVFGLPTEKLMFVGFLPSRQSERLTQLRQLSAHRGSLLFFEAPHRIVQSLKDMCETFGDDCRAGIAREMTKLHEVVRTGSLAQLLELVNRNAEHRKGEFVIGIDNSGYQDVEDHESIDRMLEILMEETSASKSAELLARMRGTSRNALYKRALQIKDSADDE